MSNPVLIATDFSAAAESVYPYAIKLAQRLKLPALLVNVDEASYWGIDASSQREHFKSHQQSSLQRAIALFEEAGVHCDAVICEGAASVRILETAHRVSAELVIMARQGLRRLERFFLGATTLRVLRNADLPILVISDNAAANPPEFESLAMATDFSADSIVAGRTTYALAKRLRMPMRLVHVRKIPVLALNDEESFADLGPEQVKGDARSQLNQQQAALGSDVSCQLLSGFDVAQTLNELEASIIAVGASGTGLLQRSLLGSNAENLVRIATRPVLVVRSGVAYLR